MSELLQEMLSIAQLSELIYSSTTLALPNGGLFAEDIEELTNSLSSAVGITGLVNGQVTFYFQDLTAVAFIYEGQLNPGKVAVILFGKSADGQVVPDSHYYAGLFDMPVPNPSTPQ